MMQALNPDDVQMPSGEPWQAALARLERICKSAWEHFEDEESGEQVTVSLADALAAGRLLQRHARLDEAVFAARCQQLGFVPCPPLQALFCAAGGFSLHEVYWEYQEAPESRAVLLQTLDRQAEGGLLPLAESIDRQHAPGIAGQCLGEAAATALNTRFAAFAVAKLDGYSEWSRHLVVDAQGRLGSFLFQEDAWPQTQARSQHLLQAGLVATDLDALLQAHIQAAIGELFRCNDMDLSVPGFPLPES